MVDAWQWKQRSSCLLSVVLPIISLMVVTFVQLQTMLSSMISCFHCRRRYFTVNNVVMNKKVKRYFNSRIHNADQNLLFTQKLAIKELFK